MPANTYPAIVAIYCGPSAEAPGLMGDCEDKMIAYVDVALNDTEFVQIQMAVQDLYFVPAVTLQVLQRAQKLVEGLTGVKARFALE